MTNERDLKVGLYHGVDEMASATPEELIECFQRMGLKTTGLFLDWMKFAEFEMFGTDGGVKIEVKRPDGNLTQCYLSSGQSEDDGHKYVYLQIATKITPDDPSYGTEAYGIFPVAIVGVQSSAHIGGYQNFESLNFLTENGGTVGIREDGTIDFGQGKF